MQEKGKQQRPCSASMTIWITSQYLFDRRSQTELAGLRKDFSEKTETPYTPLKKHQFWTYQTKSETFLMYTKPCMMLKKTTEICQKAEDSHPWT